MREPYVARQAKLFRCPEDRFLNAAQRALGWEHRARSIRMNTYMGVGMAKDSMMMGNPVLPLRALGRGVIYHRYDEMRKLNPANAWVITDGHPDTLTDPSHRPGLCGTERLARQLPQSWGNILLRGWPY